MFKKGYFVAHADIAEGFWCDWQQNVPKEYEMRESILIQIIAVWLIAKRQLFIHVIYTNLCLTILWFMYLKRSSDNASNSNHL